MIHNQGQLHQTRQEIERLRERLATLKSKGVRGNLRELQEASLRKMLRDLEGQKAVYEEARQGRVRSAVLERLLSPGESGGRPRIGEAMVLLRLSRRVTQAELARRLGTRREVVARWEREDYASYTLENILKIFKALGCRLALHVRVAG